MSLMRSPKKASPSGGNSSSYPDLSKLSALESDPRNVTTRKRKTPESNFAYEFGEFKKEILEIIKETNKCQIENITSIGQNISSINEQLRDMKNTTEQLITENGLLKTQIATLNNTVKVNEEKITSLQNEIKQLKSDSRTSRSSEFLPALLTTCDEAIIELQDRAERSKNIIITGIPEQMCTNVNERRELDLCKAYNIIKRIYPECPETKKIIRLGKYEGKKSRPLKICFESQEPVKTILRNRSNLNESGVRIFCDQTPYQQKVMINLKKELQQRQENGEMNLRIKYVKGAPKIMTVQPKN